jgi:hypothetical protein
MTAGHGTCSRRSLGHVQENWAPVTTSQLAGYRRRRTQRRRPSRTRSRWPAAALAAASLLPEVATAFRSCTVADSYAYAASTHYLVSEIEFDPVTGLASGTQTIYNYANQHAIGFDECHVTYALTGSYTAGAETFVLDAVRSNYSPACPRDLIDAEYPRRRYYTLQMRFTEDGVSQVRNADSGELLAGGYWRPGRTAFKTGETCTLF